MAGRPELSTRLLKTLIVCAVMPMSPSLSGCRCGQEAPYVAGVVSFVPLTELSLAGRAWSAATKGAKLRAGDALRTGEDGTAELDIVGHGKLKVAPSSLVRFTALGSEGGSKELRLSIENGSLEAESSAASTAPLLVIDGPTGRLRLHRGSRANLRVEQDRRVRLRLEVGRAELESGAEPTEVVEGQTLLLTIGDAGRVQAEVVEGELDAGLAAPAAAVSAPALPQADAAIPDAAIDETAGAVTIRLTQRARLEIRAPGAEEWTPSERRRNVVPPGAAFRVVGAGTAEIAGPQGAVVVVHEGGRGVLLGNDGARVRVRIAGGHAEGRTTGAGTAVLAVPGGQVSTGHIGSSAAFRVGVIDATSTRVNVVGGVATVVTDSGQEQVETGSEVILRSGATPRVTAPREVQPILGGGSGVIYDANKRGGFTARFEPIAGCKAYTVDLRSAGRSRTSAVVSRPWISVPDAPYGAYRWTAKCAIGGAGAPPPAGTREGRVTRAADGSGRKSLPSRAPRNSLDTTGRTYTVMYQNRPPAITIRWRKAPPASAYQLSVRHTSGRVVHSGSHAKATASFRSGFFRDGEYFWFWRAQGVGSGGTSPVTRVRIEYDQQTPAIYIAEPANGAAGGGSVRVRGEAAVGSTVSVNGVQLDLDDAYRFDQMVPATKNLLIFRVTTPGRGTGLYLRHLGH